MKKRLLKCIILFILLITFFSVFINVKAASFEYKDFNWEEFSKKQNDFWISYCGTSKDPDCKDRILETKERFYTRLYELLAKTQNMGLSGKIDDNIIIATVFFGLDESSFRDPFETGEYNPFKIDDDDNSLTKDKYILGHDGEVEKARKYFENEEDTLKTLINNFIGYEAICYADSGEVPIPYTDSYGNTFYSCSNTELIAINGKCRAEVDKFKGSFFDTIGIFSFFKTENDRKCQEKADEKGFTDSWLDTAQDKSINEDFYWSFLENTEYFDKKDHLQEYYVSVLNSVNKKHMSELTDDELLEYQDKIIEIRKRMIRRIKEVVKYYEAISSQYNNQNIYVDSYWWPIGSVETTDNNGKVFAIGDPESVNLINKFGLIRDPITNEPNSHHNGVDISGVGGSTNVIASKDGVVVYAPEIDGGGCVTGDIECASGYGNYVMLQHVDGNYTLYAHLDTGSVTVKNGDAVSKGQVIGKVGNTGKTEGNHLHFEVRVGGTDAASAQDPLNFISAEEPRKASSGSGDFYEFIRNMENAKFKEGSKCTYYPKVKEKYCVFDAEKKGKYRTFSYGVVVEFNGDVIKKHGLVPSALQYGTTVDIPVADAIWMEVMQQHLDSVKKTISKAGLTLSQNQIEALASLEFNCGNIKGFVNAYKKYGSTDALCKNYWLGKSSGGYAGLPKRRRAECDLFVNGVYDMNIYD